MTLYPYQERAVKWLSRKRRGLVVAPAGSGKTLMAFTALETVVLAKPRPEPVKVGWMAGTEELIIQAREAFSRHPAMTTLVEFKAACYQAETDWSDRSVLIVDECHKATAETLYRQIMSGPNCRWGLTATPWGSDPERNRLLREMFDGNVFTVDRLEVGSRLAPAVVQMLDASDPGLQQPIDEAIERLKSQYMGGYLRREGRYATLEQRAAKQLQVNKSATWQAVCALGIVRNKARTAAAIEAARRHAADHVIVLVPQVKFGQQIADKLGAVLCHSGMKDRAATLARFAAGEIHTIVATSMLEEGFDAPIADVLVVLSGGRSARKAEQTTGRVLRAREGKTHGLIYDFLDTCHTTMANHAKERLKVYRSLDYTIHLPDVKPEGALL